VPGLATLLEVRDGRTIRVNLGGPGRALVGRFEAAKDLGLPIEWPNARIELYRRAPHFGSASDEPSRETYRAFLYTEERRASISALIRPSMAMAHSRLNPYRRATIN
jgi:hypothetical protein